MKTENNLEEIEHDIYQDEPTSETIVDKSALHLKTPIILLYTLVSLVLLVASTYAALQLFNDWRSIIMGGALMLAAVVIHIVGRKAKWCLVLSFLLNSMANGFSIAAYYLSKALALTIGQALLAILPAALITLLAAITLLILPQLRRPIVVAACILNAACGITAIVLAITTGAPYYLYAFFALLISFFYLPVLYVTKSRNSLLKTLSYCSFCIFIVVTFIVIVILSEGEVFDGFADFALTDERGKRRKK